MDEHKPIEEMELFIQFEAVAEWTWNEVSTWKEFAKATVGKQLVRAADSIGANLVEGDGRYSDKDAIHFFVIARASARETRLWIQRSIRRGLLGQEIGTAKLEQITCATKLLNNLIKYRRNTNNVNYVREDLATYEG